MFLYYESISCAQRGKVSVAYSLLIKPLRDNLLYLEWLLADKEEFYQNFLYKDIGFSNVLNYKLFSKERNKKLLNQELEILYGRICYGLVSI